MQLSCQIVRQRVRPLAWLFDHNDESLREIQLADADELHLLGRGGARLIGVLHC